MQLGIIFDLKKFAVYDGPGIRTTVFMKGCPLNCIWCHNPESISAELQTIIKETKLGEKKFNNPETIGKEVSADIVIMDVLKDKIFYEESGGGVTFSGGEPFAQSDFLLELLRLSKANNLHTTIDTSGFTSKDNLQKVLPYTDLFLYDIKLIDPKLHEKYTNVSNNIILANLRFLLEAGANVNIRIPLIPQITDTAENISEIIKLLKSLKFDQSISLLPYHNTAKTKYENLGVKYAPGNIEEHTKAQLEEIADKFAQAGFDVKIGG